MVCYRLYEFNTYTYAVYRGAKLGKIQGGGGGCRGNQD